MKKEKKDQKEAEKPKKVKKTTPKIAKYVISCQKTCEKLVEKARKNHLVAQLGKRNEGFLVDVLWISNYEEESAEWEEFKIDLKTEGIHSFRDLSYLKNKL